MTKEELKKREIDFLALQVLLCMEASGISPENHNSCLHILKKCDGTEITLKSAYYNVKRNINYLDDELLKKLNSFPCIKVKLKKDCNN